jgi:hypothetical protein
VDRIFILSCFAVGCGFQGRKPHVAVDKRGMNKFVLAIALCPGALCTAETHASTVPRVYIEIQAGFESYLSAAIVKKHVPVVVTQNKEEARFILMSAVFSKEESTGSKIARCMFAYCAGIQGSQTATVQLVDAKTQEIAWAGSGANSWRQR